MALNTEIWLRSLVENFYPDNSFAAKSIDDSVFVNNRKVHIPNAGRPSNVEINRKTKPATVKTRTDNDLEYEMDELTTDPIYIPHADVAELSYDKRSSILANDRAQLQEVAHKNLLYRWYPGASNVILTTGKARAAHTSNVATNSRAAITKNDVLKLMELFNSNDVPKEERYLLLDSSMYIDLLADLSESDKWMFQNSADVQKGILGKLYGFNIMERSSVLRIAADTKAIIKWEEQAQATELAAAIAWQKDCVSRAMGETKMFDSTNNPTYYGDIYSFLMRTGGAPRRYDKKGVYLLAEAPKA